MFQNVLLFIHLKMFKIGCMLNVIYSNKLCIACCFLWHRTTIHLVSWWYSCGSHLVRSVGFSQLTAWLAAQWCGLVVMCNVQHFVTNHIESQISQERRAALPSPFTGGWLHMCSLKKMHYSLTSCQLYFLVPLSSFLAHHLYISLVLLNTNLLC